MDEKILQFSSITQASTDTAQHYLSIADEDLEMALQLFWESGGEDVAELSRREAETVKEPVTGVTSRESRQEELERIGGSDEEEVEDDEALAHRLQREEEMERDKRLRRSEERKAQDAAAQVEETGHRAPIAAHQDVLIGGGGGAYDSMDMDSSSLEDLLSGRSTTDTNIFGPRSSHHPSPFARTRSTQRGTQDDEEARRTSRLEELFRPPTELILPGRATIDRAREVAKSEDKWVMVNVQDLSNFQCQILNRDVWKDPEMIQLVKENFVFLQYVKGSREAVEYEQFYRVKGEPHVAILDPLTGERLREWNSPLTLTRYLIEFESFLASEAGLAEEEVVKEDKGKQRADEGSIDNPVVLDNVPSTSTRSFSGGKRKAFSDMTEDEMLQAALSASAKEAGLESPVLEEGSEEAEALEASINEEATIPVTMPEEPPAGPETTRVQFRLPDGSRVVRRFLKTDPVRYLFHFIQLSYPDMEQAEIIAVREPLSGSKGMTLEEKHLLNAALTVDPN
ncbi:MAG: hypothetical protein DHS80DRAFT_22265 [Piptocephalis tieghemiana]|nr:MAG: hypothetical protein DHS80DRAFT_22265 [Piptocephalis tieghemiana]